MTPSVSKKKQVEALSEHLVVLRNYARKSIASGKDLGQDEVDDRDSRFEAYSKIGAALKLTESEMVTLMFKGLFDDHNRCGCHQCRTRRQD